MDVAATGSAFIPYNTGMLYTGIINTGIGYSLNRRIHLHSGHEIKNQDDSLSSTLFLGIFVLLFCSCHSISSLFGVHFHWSFLGPSPVGEHDSRLVVKGLKLHACDLNTCLSY